jgi:C4-dicarboxylate-specific signal transduction histidine kinase
MNRATRRLQSSLKGSEVTMSKLLSVAAYLKAVLVAVSLAFARGDMLPVIVISALFRIIQANAKSIGERVLRRNGRVLPLAHMNRLSMMGELAASLAHEIKQPISATHVHANAARRFLDRSPPNLDEVREALAHIVKNANRAGEIVDRIRNQIRKAPPQKKRFDLSEAINAAIELARSAIVENGVSVQTRLAEDSFAVRGDRVQLEQVLLNLILNAVEAMGTVEAGARELLISTERSHTGVLVAVSDSGLGINATDLERVFQAFYTTKSSGTGMGLLICRTIIDAHGGKLWAEANEPRGAVFQFTLPDAEQERPNPFQSSLRTREPGKDSQGSGRNDRVVAYSHSGRGH